MTSTRASKLTLAALSTAILMAVVATLLFAMPNGAFAAEPDRPTDLTATAVDHDTVSLTWSHPDPATVDHYQVLSRTVGASTRLSQVGTSTTTSFEHDGLEPESTYIYRVKPVNSAGEEGRRSARAEATTPAEETPASEPEPDPAPTPPQRSDDKGQGNIARASHQVWSATLTVRNNSGVLGCSNGVANNFCSVHLSDDDFNHDSTDYAFTAIFLRTNGRLEAVFDTTLTTASQTLTLNVDGTAFAFEDADSKAATSRYWSSSGLSWTTGDSVPLTLTETASAPDAPTELTATANGETEIKLSWTAPSNNGGETITGYKVEVSANGETGWSNVAADTASTDTTYSHTGLSAGNTRHYRVSAINSAGTGEISNVGGATTAAANVLVSNTGRNVDLTGSVAIGDQDKTHSQGFDTGPNPGGYNLASVGVYVNAENLTSGDTFTVHIYTDNGSGGMDTLAYTLTSPASYTTRAVNTFTAPAGATLDTSTDYLVVFEGTAPSSTSFIVGATPSNGQDRGTKGGWGIENAYRFNGISTSTGNSYQVSVNGSAIPTAVPTTWALVPTGLNVGDKFRLLFLSSTTRNASSTGIGAYNTFIQDLANAGHTDIQQYGDEFKVVGCTRSSEAPANTRTLYTTSDKGVPIYWLNGAKAADDYEDFYDGSWDEEANDKNESGTDGPDTSQPANRPWTGCDHDGTRKRSGLLDDDYLGDSISTVVGRPNASGSGNGPLSGDTSYPTANTRPMYGLSEIFQVADASSDATLSALMVNDGTNDLTLTPTFVSGTYAYQADVGNAVNTATLTATVNDDTAEVTTVTLAGTAIADTNFTDGITVPSLVEGDNEIVVTVTAQDATTQTYTVTVTRSTLPELSFDSINITVDEDDSQATLSVELSQASTVTVTVDYATSDNTAEAGDDYTETSGTLTFAAGETVMAIIVPILDDAIYETLERFNVTLSNPAGATLPAFPGAQINIALDESPPTASIDDVTVSEGAGTMTLTLNLSHESSRRTPYRTQTSYIGGTATQGADYVNFISGGEARITVPAGDTQATLDITITDDTAGESSETITIRWDNDPTGGNNGDATPDTINFTGTITDNDSADDSATGKPGITGAAQVGMTLTAGTADIMDTDGLTTPGYTYQWLRAGSNISGATSSTYTLTSSDYGETIQVKVDFTDDASNAHSLTSDETVPVAPVAATCPTDTDTVWCTTLTVGHSLDSDGDPSGSGFEARSGRTAFGSLSGATFTHLGVNYTVKTVWGGAIHDLVLSTTPNLPLNGAGLTMHVQKYAGELDLPLADASFDTSDHWFFVNALYVGSSGQLSDVPLIRTERTREARVQAPPDVGTKVMVRLSINLTVPTAPRHLNATAVGDNRINLSWDAPSSNGGSTITGYKVQVSNDGNSWTTRVANTGSSNRTHSHTGLSAGDIRHYRVSAINASGTGPHSNVDSATTGLPTVSISNATTTEGGDIVFVITISPTIDGFLSVSYGTGTDSLPPGSMGARKDDDYVPHHPAGANVQIGYGQTSIELTFTTVDDDLVEGTEIFAIGLYPSAYEGRDFSYGKRTAIATIRDDENGGQAYQDSVPGDTSTNRSISAGGSVTNRIETVDDADWYRATLTKDHCYQIKVEGSSADETLTLQYPAVRGVYRSDGTHILNTYENAGGSGTTAISNVKLDTTGTYYIAAGLYRFENGGTFRMTLTDLGTSDDSCGAAKPGGPMQISVADASMSEASAHRKYMSFIVTLDRRADTEVTVNYTTVNGTATAGQDYEATSGTLVFDQGDVQKTVYVPIEYDSHDEDDETLTLVLSNPTVAQIERGVATGTIIDYE